MNRFPLAAPSVGRGAAAVLLLVALATAPVTAASSGGPTGRSTGA